MITRIYQSKFLSKHISCDCKCTFDGKKKIILIKNKIMTNIDVSAKKSLKPQYKKMHMES